MDDGGTITEVQGARTVTRRRDAEADLTRFDASVPREQAVERLATTLTLMDQALVALHRLDQDGESARTLHQDAARTAEGGAPRRSPTLGAVRPART